MNNKFEEELERELKKRFPESTIHFLDRTKNNGIVLRAVCVRQKDSDVSPTIYYEKEGFLESYETGVPIEEIADEICQILHAVPEVHICTAGLLNYENVKNKMFCCLINKERNKDLLESAVHKDFLDLTLVLKFAVDAGGGQIGEILIQNQMLDLWGISDVDALFELAKENSKRLYPGHIQLVDDYIRNFYPFWGSEDEEDDVPRLYTASNLNEIEGAGVMVYDKDIIRTLADELDSDLFVLPSSIHEIILCKAIEGTDEMFSSLIKEVNREVLPEQEMLSDSLYLYRRDTDTISIVV